MQAHEEEGDNCEICGEECAVSYVGVHLVCVCDECCENMAADAADDE